jgi:DNA-binding NarL/FixJ family response regulator
MSEAAEPTSVRLCVVDSLELGSAYPRLDECGMSVMALVPSVDQVSAALLHEYDAVLIGCSAAELENVTFQANVARLVRIIPAIAVVPPGADAAIAAKIGFQGLVERDVSPEALARTVRAVSQGEIAFPRAAVAGLFRLLSLLPLSIGHNDQPVPLTPRQQQIVDLIAQGATDREIAAHLRISESTAHKHVQNALRRSKTKTRSQLVAVARQSAVT